LIATSTLVAKRLISPSWQGSVFIPKEQSVTLGSPPSAFPRSDEADTVFGTTVNCADAPWQKADCMKNASRAALRGDSLNFMTNRALEKHTKQGELTPPEAAPCP
jgi:hypothetical protein